MFIIYDSLFLIIAIFYLPVYLFKRKFHSGFLRRLGFLPRNLKLNRPIWVHAVSVGEAKLVKALIEELRKIYPARSFVISTVTQTGNKIARTIAKEGDFVTYLPLDLSFIVRSVVAKVNPSLFILAETEIWPNLISELAQRKIPVITVNGRISDASFRGYSAVKFLIKPILKKISLFCVQSVLDAERLMRLGVEQDKIKVSGNMKFDSKIYVKEDPSSMRGKLGVKAEEKLLIAGSTHPQEEEILLDAYKEIIDQFPPLKLFIAPRHPERSKEIAELISAKGFRPVFVSNLPFECSTCVTRPVFILDVIGELVNYYSASDMVFVGGSLVPKGGQNILEPALLGKPVLFGPYMFNFRDITALFLKNKAAILAAEKEDLKKGIIELLNNPQSGIEMGKRAKKLVLENQGATLKNSQYIKQYLE